MRAVAHVHFVLQKPCFIGNVPRPQPFVRVLAIRLIIYWGVDWVSVIPVNSTLDKQQQGPDIERRVLCVEHGFVFHLSTT